MSKAYIGIIVAVVTAFGVGYILSQSGDKPSEQDNTTGATSSETSGKTLDLSGQQLTELLDEVLSQKDITVLNLSNNQLTTLPAGIAGMTSLEVLNVENNRLEGFPNEINQLTSLRGLFANNNRMESVRDSLGAMTWLDVLDISGNNIPSSEVTELKTKLPETQIKY